MSSDEHPARAPRLGALWFGLMGAPIAWFVCFGFAYTLTPWTCSFGHAWPQHLVALIGAIICVCGGVTALREWDALGRTPPDDATGIIPRGRFMAALGVLTSGMFLLLVIAQEIPNFIVGACQ